MSREVALGPGGGVGTAWVGGVSASGPKLGYKEKGSAVNTQGDCRLSWFPHLWLPRTRDKFFLSGRVSEAV